MQAQFTDKGRLRAALPFDCHGLEEAMAYG